jgi:hypothetical protein
MAFDPREDHRVKVTRGDVLRVLLAFFCCVVVHQATAQSPREQAHSPATATWQKTSINGFAFEAPFAMQAINVPLEGPHADNIRKEIVKWDSKQGDKDGIFATASVVTYVPTAEVSLDGAVKGAMGGLAEKIGIPLPAYTAKKTTINGQSARRVHSSFTTEVGGSNRTVSIRALFITSGNQLAQLITIDMRSTSETTATAEKILGSASLTASPAG